MAKMTFEEFLLKLDEHDSKEQARFEAENEELAKIEEDLFAKIDEGTEETGKVVREEVKKLDDHLSTGLENVSDDIAQGTAMSINAINELGDKFVESFLGPGHWAVAIISTIVSMIVAWAATTEAIREKSTAYVYQVITYDSWGNVIKATEHISRTHQWFVICLVGILAFCVVMLIYACVKLTKGGKHEKESEDA